MALHSFILRQTEDTLVLGLVEKPFVQRKKYAAITRNYQRILYQKPLRLEIQLVSDSKRTKMTPAAYRHKVYQHRE